MNDLANAVRAEVERASVLFRTWGEVEVTGNRVSASGSERRSSAI